MEVLDEKTVRFVARTTYDISADVEAGLYGDRLRKHLIREALRRHNLRMQDVNARVQLQNSFTATVILTKK